MENGENSRNYSEFKKTKNSVLGNVIRKAHAKFPEAQLKIPKNRGELECLTKILIIMTKIWAEKRKFDKVVNFEADQISTCSQQRFVHSGEVNR